MQLRACNSIAGFAPLPVSHLRGSSRRSTTSKLHHREDVKDPHWPSQSKRTLPQSSAIQPQPSADKKRTAENRGLNRVSVKRVWQDLGRLFFLAAVLGLLLLSAATNVCLVVTSFNCRYATVVERFRLPLLGSGIHCETMSFQHHPPTCSNIDRKLFLTFEYPDY